MYSTGPNAQNSTGIDFIDVLEFSTFPESTALSVAPHSEKRYSEPCTIPNPYYYLSGSQDLPLEPEYSFLSKSPTVSKPSVIFVNPGVKTPLPPPEPEQYAKHPEYPEHPMVIGHND